MIKTAILGYGRSGSTMHAGAIEKSAAFDMAAVCDIDANARSRHIRALAAEHTTITKKCLTQRTSTLS